METEQYIDSGILELYVFGILSASETAEVAKMAEKFPEIQTEILSIEKAMMTLNFAMSPKLSANNYAKIYSKIFDNNGVIQMNAHLKPNSLGWKSYLGWVAALIFGAGIGYQYLNTKKIEKNYDTQVAAIEKEKLKLKNDFNLLNEKNNHDLEMAALVKNDICNRAIALAGQKAAPKAKAKIYWNKYSNEVYVDATDLPEPPEGMEYQIWSLKLNPLTPKSIGLLTDFKNNDAKFFGLNSADEAEAFGITLEPKGGSLTPNMEQLYTLGKV